MIWSQERRHLVEVEQKQRAELQKAVAVGDLLALMALLVDAARAAVTDDRTVESVAARPIVDGFAMTPRVVKVTTTIRVANRPLSSRGFLPSKGRDLHDPSPSPPHSTRPVPRAGR